MVANAAAVISESYASITSTLSGRQPAADQLHCRDTDAALSDVLSAKVFIAPSLASPDRELSGKVILLVD